MDRNKITPFRQQTRVDLFDLAAQLEQHVPGVLKRYKQQRRITDDNQGYFLTASGYPQMRQDVIRDKFRQIATKHSLNPPTSDKGEKLSLTKDYWGDYRDLSPAIDLFLDLQAKGKLFGFFNKLIGDHIHPRYTPIVRSGRVSARDPNIQQMPRSGDVREMFVPSPGHVLLAIDFSALELRTLAAVCLQKYGKSRLAEVINSGKDPHRYSYCQMYDMTESEFAAWQERQPREAKAARDKVKGITFGVPGSMRPDGLVQYVKKSYGQQISREEAENYRDMLIHTVYPEWRSYLSQTGNRVHTLTGRVRGRIARAGQLFNTQFQGLASDGAKLCLWRLMRAGYRLVGFVHDEFLIELPADEDNTEAAREIETICCQTMEQFTPGVKIATEYALSDRWSKAAERVERDGKLTVWSPE